MGRHKQRDSEKRKIIIQWLNTASNLSPGNILFIPMKHGVARTQYLALGKQIVKEMEAYFEKSVFHGLVLYSKSKRGIIYLAIERPLRITNTAFIKNKNKKDRAIQIMTKSRYTRKAQIILMLSEGHTKGELIKALGASITPEEKKLLN